MKKVSMRIRKEYFEAIVAGRKKFELRPFSDYWHKRIEKIDSIEETVVVFICGKRVHRRRVLSIQVGKPEEFLGRPLSETGKIDIPTRYCYAFFLGEEVKPEIGG